MKSQQQYNILFPVDFSTACVLAANHVRAWVERFGATLHTLHIIDTHAIKGSGGLRDERFYDEQRLLVAKRTADLKYFSDRYLGEDVAHYTVLSGEREQQIKYFAKNKNINLIMLPRNRPSLIASLRGDSLSATLLEQCSSSVWITEHLNDSRLPCVRKVLCAVHFEPGVIALEAQVHRILHVVREVAGAFEARITFLRVMRGKQGRTKASTDTQTPSQEEPWIAQARELLGYSADVLRETGNVESVIQDVADRVAADLVVVGRTRPLTLGFGVQGNILKIDHVVRSPVLSVW
jgi:nucleotide-binding universal stress UspA family protein